MTLRDALAGPWLAGHTLLRRLASSPPRGAFRILLVHDVPEQFQSAFERLIDYVAAHHGFITPTEAETRLAGEAPTRIERTVPYLLTFDDGYITHHTLAQGVLARHGIKAVFFLCPGLIDLPQGEKTDAIAHHIFADTIAADEVRRRRLALMGWPDVAALAERGHTIGAHTLTHESLVCLEGEALNREIKGSRERIADVTGKEITWFASPYGEIDTVDRTALAAVGEHFRYCRSGVRGLNTPATHRLGLLAESVDFAAAFAWQKLEIAGGLDFRYRTARARLAAMLKGLS